MSAAAIEEQSLRSDLTEGNGEKMTTPLSTSTQNDIVTSTIMKSTSKQQCSAIGAVIGVGSGIGVGTTGVGLLIAPPPPPQPSAVGISTTAVHTTAVKSATVAAAPGNVSTTVVAMNRSCGGDSGDSSPSQIPPPIEQHCRLLEEEVQNLKESEARLQQQYSDSQRRERMLMRRLAIKEQEIQDYANQIAEYKAAQAPGPVALRSALLDPAVNILFEKLKTEIQSTRAKLEESQNELAAWKFTPDSKTGKRLMAKCRLLYQENEELGNMTSNGRVAKLESELAMQKNLTADAKKSQSKLIHFLHELDEEVDGMQSTTLLLQKELKTAKDRIHILEKELYNAKNGLSVDDIDKSTYLMNGKTSPNNDNNSESYDGSEQQQQLQQQQQQQRTSKINFNNYVNSSNNNNNNNNNINNSNNSNSSIIIVNNNSNNNNNNINNSNNIINDNTDELRTKNANNYYNGNELLNNVNGVVVDDDTAQNEPNTNSSIECISSSSSTINNSSNNSNNNNNNNSKLNKITARKRNYDSDSSENSSTNGCTLRSNKKHNKKARRSSVLSIDLNEEDTQIADESDEDDNNQRVITRRKSARNNHQNGDHIQ